MTSATSLPSSVGTCLGHVVAVLRGRAVPYTRPGSRSGIAKSPVTQAFENAVLDLSARLARYGSIQIVPPTATLSAG